MSIISNAVRRYRTAITRLFVGVMLLLALMARPATALVDMNSGSYSNMWHDVDPTRTGIGIVRAYKSRTLFNGIFGFGWCSEMETSLHAYGPETIILTHCGDGLEVVYSAEHAGGANAAEAHSRRIRAAAGRGIIAPLDDETSGLLDEQFFDIVREVGINAGLDTPTLPRGRFVSPDGDVLVVTAQGANLTHDGKRFDRFGSLIEYRNDEGRVISIARSARTWTIRSNLSRIDLNFNDAPIAHVTSITSGIETLSEYRYDGEMLVWNRNNWGSIYTYGYNDYRNLTRASWPDGTFIEIDYDNERDLAVGFRDRDDCRETYVYEFGEWHPEGDLKRRFDALVAQLPPVAIDPSPQLSYTSHVKKYCGTELVADNHYHFNHVRTKEGPIAMQRLVTLVGASNGTAVLYRLDDGTPRYVASEGGDAAAQWSVPGSLAVRRQFRGIVQTRQRSGCTAYTGTEFWPEQASLPRHVAVHVLFANRLDSSGRCVLTGLDVATDDRVTPIRFDYDRSALRGVTIGDAHYPVEKNQKTDLTMVDSCLGVDPSAKGDRLFGAIVAARTAGRCDESAVARAFVRLFADYEWNLPRPIG